MFLPRKEEWTICKNFFPNEILILGEFYAMPPWIFPEGIAMLKILAEQVTGFRNFFPIRFRQDSGAARKTVERTALRRPLALAIRTVSISFVPSAGSSGLRAMLMRPANILRSGAGTGT